MDKQKPKRSKAIWYGMLGFGILLFLFGIIQVLSPGTAPATENNYCTAKSRNADFCIELYKPVCGWFNQSIQCIKYPCAATYSNECFACMDPRVEYWTEGECPQ